VLSNTQRRDDGQVERFVPARSHSHHQSGDRTRRFRTRHRRIPRRRERRGARTAGPHALDRLALEDGVVGVACDGCPPLPDLAQRFATADGLLQVCPVCSNARKLDQADLIENSEVAGAVP
jgi:hypothetical protein